MQDSEVAHSRFTQNMSEGDIITRLPKELQLDIFDLLGYQEAIVLSQANKYSHATVDPRAWPASEKEAFVYKAQFWEKHNMATLHSKYDWLLRKYETKSDGHACFSCYRVRPKSAFSNSQTRRKGDKSGSRHDYIGHTRFCLDCAIERSLYRPGTLIMRVTGETCTARPDGSLRVFKGDFSLVCGTCQALREYDEVVLGMRCTKWIYVLSVTGHAESNKSVELPCTGHTQIECRVCGERHHIERHVHCSQCTNHTCSVCFQSKLDARSFPPPSNELHAFSFDVNLKVSSDVIGDLYNRDGLNVQQARLFRGELRRQRMSLRDELRRQRMALRDSQQTDVMEGESEDVLQLLGI